MSVGGAESEETAHLNAPKLKIERGTNRFRYICRNATFTSRTDDDERVFTFCFSDDSTVVAYPPVASAP